MTIELQTVRTEIIIREVRQRVIAAGKEPLVGQVVNGEANPRGPPLPCHASVVLNDHRGRTCLPVVQVQHIGLPRQMQCHVRDDFGEENEPRRIVGIIHSVFLIQPGPLIEVRLVHEIHGEFGEGIKAPDRSSDLPAAQRELQRQINLLKAGKLPANARVKGGHHSHLVAHPRQRLGQRAYHIGQAAGFRVWKDFAACEQDSHAGIRSILR